MKKTAAEEVFVVTVVLLTGILKHPSLKVSDDCVCSESYRLGVLFKSCRVGKALRRAHHHKERRLGF